MNISEVFIRRPIATSLLMAALALVGIVSFPLLPVAPLPQVDFPTIQVSATVPGASPETMAATVATPLERQFGQIAGITQMSSVSSLGSTAITLQFDLNRNIDGAAVGRTGRDYRRRLAITEDPFDTAYLSQGQPGGFADPDRGGDVRDDPAAPKSTISPRTSLPSRFRRYPASPRSSSAVSSGRQFAFRSIQPS